MQMSKSWLWSHREQWGYLVWSKLKRFWSPFLHQTSRLARWGMLLSWGIVLPLSLPALVATFWSFARTKNSAFIVHVIIVSALAGYVIVYVFPRYRFPIEPFFILLAAVSVDWLAVQIAAMRVLKASRVDTVPAVV